MATDGAKLAAADFEDAAAPANLFLLRRQRHGLIRLALRHVRNRARKRIERELVAVPRVLDRFRTLDDVETQVERVPPEDVSHVVAADDDHLLADFLGDALQSGRAHLARGPNREPVTRNQEGLAAMDAGPEVRHQVPERPRFPALIERLQTLGDTIGRRRDLIGVDGVELARRWVAPSDPRRSMRVRARALAADRRP